MEYKDFLGSSFNENSNEIDIEKLQKDIISQKDTVNIIIMGASGVGKSTLVNAIFGENIAEQGVGEPITQGIERFEIKEKGLCLWDTKGIEAKAYKETMELIENEIESTLNTLDKTKAPHIAWLCIAEPSNHIEEREKELIKITKKFGIPTIIVFTNTQFEEGDTFVTQAQKILNEEHESFIQNRYVRVNSIDYSFKGIRIEKEGLEKLVDLTSECLGEANQNVETNFIKIQRVNNKKRLNAMKEKATTIVNLASVAAGTAGACPIPYSDAPIIAAIQSTMIYKINSEFEVSLETSTSTAFLTRLLGITALAGLGKKVVGGILKFIPAAGQAVGAVISATTASTLTKGVGMAYIAVLEHYYDEETGEVRLPDEVDTILSIFKYNFKN